MMMTQTTPINTVFSALANPVRRGILAQLMQGSMSVGDLSQPLSISPPAISRHLKILEEANLIQHEKQTQYRIYSLNVDGFSQIFEYIEQYRRCWNQQFDHLEDELKQWKSQDAE